MMRNKKRILLFLVALMVTGLAAGCGAGNKQAAPNAPPAAAKPAASMPNEDPTPIAQDLERKLKDTGAMVTAGKWAEAKLIAAEALKTNDRLLVHVTDARMKEHLRQSINDANAAVNASPADQKSAAAKVTAALEAVQQASLQLRGHQHN